MKPSLIAVLSIFGPAMGAATLAGVIPRGFEGPLWLVIGLISAVVITSRVTSRHFVHGFLVGFINGFVSPLIQVLFFSLYLKNNAYAAESFQRLPAGLSPQLFVLVCSPFIAIVSGLIVGLMSWVAGKVIRPKGASA